VHRSEKNGSRSSVAGSNDCRPLRFSPFHDSQDVLGPFLPRRHGIAWDAVRSSRTSAVEDDQPAELRQIGEELGHARNFEKKFDVAAEAITIKKIKRAIAEDLLSHIGVADGDVSCLGTLHGWRQFALPVKRYRRPSHPHVDGGAMRPNQYAEWRAFRALDCAPKCFGGGVRSCRLVTYSCVHAVS
jgi:hypothetical protein